MIVEVIEVKLLIVSCKALVISCPGRGLLRICVEYKMVALVGGQASIEWGGDRLV